MNLYFKFGWWWRITGADVDHPPVNKSTKPKSNTLYFKILYFDCYSNSNQFTVITKCIHFFISCIFSAKFSSLVTLTLLFKSRRKRRNASRHHFYSMSTSVHLHTTFNSNTTLFYFASCDNKNLYFCVFVDLS